MQIKRFEAKNMTEALRQIKRDLGSEAVILSAKDLRRENRLLGISRKIGVEVTAAIDEVHPGVHATRQTAVNASLPEESSPESPGRSPKMQHKGFLHNIYDRVNLRAQAARSEGRPAAEHRPDPSRVDSPVRPQADAGAPHAPARSMNIAPADGSMTRYLSKNGLSAGSLTLEKNKTNFVALVGNAGVGKTTTIAKLAAYFKSVRKETVGLLALDRQRIGGFEQLGIYADSMGLPFAPVHAGHDLAGALDKLSSCRLVLVDCPAVDPVDNEGPAYLKTQFETLGGVRTLLTVSAESREEDLLETARRYADLNPTGVVITKTDLTRNYSDMVNFLCRQRLAVLFFSNGRRVPFDLTQATIEALAAHFLQHRPYGTSAIGHGEDPHEAPDQDDQVPSVYLANKSSDIFHRPGCKWIRLINKANVVEFGSFAEAVNHRFKPCRYCNPQHLSITGMLSRESAAL